MPPRSKKASIPNRYQHLRLGKISDAALEALKTENWVKSVVLHVHGDIGEHPHWHVFIDTEQIKTTETIRKRLRKHDVFKTYSGNEDWRLGYHDSYEVWCAYVMGNWSAEVLYHQEGMPPLPPVAAKPPIVASASAASAIEASYRIQVVRPKRSKSMKEQFVDDLKDQQWNDGCISMTNLADKKVELVDQLTDFWENAFTTPQGSVCIQYALWTFADPSVRSAIRAANYRALESFLRI
jgi:hypothetical protein